MSNLIHTQNGNVYAPGIKNRAQTQNARVAQGIASGSISQEELATLKDMRADARAGLAASKGDNGWVGPQERREVHQDLNQISRTIYAFKHN